MKTYLTCVQCLVRNTIKIAEMLSADEQEKEKIVKDLLREIADFDYRTPPPLMARRIYSYASERTGIRDPYAAQKEASTRIARELLERFLREKKLDLTDFESLVRLAIGGNIIDFGVNCDLDLDEAKKTIESAFRTPLDRDALRQAEEAMNRANSILYLLDNCGEAVFDTLLVKRYREKITVSVKGMPILNDVTRREVLDSGFGGIARRIIDTGDCTPGVSPEHSSPEFLEAFRNADLIVSKGQGNFESLNTTGKPILFLFMAKCDLVAGLLGVPKNSFQILCRNLELLSANSERETAGSKSAELLEGKRTSL